MCAWELSTEHVALKNQKYEMTTDNYNARQNHQNHVQNYMTYISILSKIQ